MSKPLLEYRRGHTQWNDKEMTLDDWWELFDVVIKQVKDDIIITKNKEKTK